MTGCDLTKHLRNKNITIEADQLLADRQKNVRHLIDDVIKSFDVQ
jgi:lipopolysaccharide export system protein LptA